MPIALKNRVPIPTAASTQAARALPPPGAGMLAISYVQQSEGNWCWAACGEMLFGQFGPAPHSQCDLASGQFGLVCCPSPGAPSACDVGCWPDASYPALGLPTTRTRGSLTRAQVQAELSAGRAVQVCYRWARGGGTHVALIVGEHANGDFEVFDPLAIYGQGPRNHSQILSAYGLGSWILTFTF